MSTPPTIVGVATGSADGGVAIVRLSGPTALAIARQRIGTLPPPRKLGRRRFVLGPGSVEDALVVQMPGPRSFTGEDIVELHVHGGERNVAGIVASLLAAGATAAGPGDFSRRAFANGRLSLDQAEGIAALLAAKTDAAVEQARRLVAGELGAEIDSLCGLVGNLRTEIEANLDFVEDVEGGDEARWDREISAVLETLRGWLRRFEAGRRARERSRVVLAGPANAGKSSLFNALLGRSRSLVHGAPGTTRDYVEAELEIGGRTMILVDTAGIRGGVDDGVESAGIIHSRQQIGGADLVLWVEAADRESQVGEAEAGEGESICVESKRDLGVRRHGWIGVSTSTGEGLETLRGRLERWATGDGEVPWIGLARHRDRAEEAMEALVEAQEIFARVEPLELVAFQLAVAERRLAEVTGRSALGALGEDVLGRIFSRFCIGK